MQGGTRRTQARWALVYAVSVGLLWPIRVAAEERLFAIYAEDGRALHAKGALVWLGERAAADGGAASTGFRLQPVAASSGELRDGDEVWLRAQDGRYLTQQGHFPLLTQSEQRASRWQVVRAAGPGELALGDAFALRMQAGSLGHVTQLELATWHGSLAVTPAQPMSAPWSLGCHFEPGPFTERWSDAVRFEVSTGAYASAVARAVAWLQASATPLRMPAGDLPLIVWDDPTLQPSPTVGYLVTDSLWAAKALQPYDPDLSDSMQAALMAAGWYGNGLNESLFHGVAAIAHRPISIDFVHGTLVDRCTTLGAAPKPVQLRVPEVAPDAAWTAGNSAQFVDSAVYTALDEHWHGATEQARARLRDVLVDSRGVTGSDFMFWDHERWVMVDQAARCDYDTALRMCSDHCPGCGSCNGVFCNVYNAGFKLGLLLYAGRVTGVASEPAFEAVFQAIERRLWEAQNDDGGVAHLAFYGPDAHVLLRSGATGEATAIGVLAESVVHADRAPPLQ